MPFSPDKVSNRNNHNQLYFQFVGTGALMKMALLLRQRDRDDEQHFSALHSQSSSPKSVRRIKKTKKAR